MLLWFKNTKVSDKVNPWRSIIMPVIKIIISAKVLEQIFWIKYENYIYLLNICSFHLYECRIWQTICFIHCPLLCTTQDRHVTDMHQRLDRQTLPTPEAFTYKNKHTNSTLEGHCLQCGNNRAGKFWLQFYRVAALFKWYLWTILVSIFL